MANDYAPLLALEMRAPIDAMQFEQPWEARTFALTMALIEHNLFSFYDFQQALIVRVKRAETVGCISDNTDYYTCWLQALEGLVETAGVMHHDVLARLEVSVVEDAASRKEHQRIKARDAEGHPIAAPYVVDPGITR